MEYCFYHLLWGAWWFWLALSSSRRNSEYQDSSSIETVITSFLALTLWQGGLKVSYFIQQVSHCKRSSDTHDWAFVGIKANGHSSLFWKEAGGIWGGKPLTFQGRWQALTEPQWACSGSLWLGFKIWTTRESPWIDYFCWGWCFLSPAEENSYFPSAFTQSGFSSIIRINEVRCLCSWILIPHHLLCLSLSQAKLPSVLLTPGL